MKTETQPQVIEFSPDVRTAAASLLNKPRRPRVICAIWRSGRELSIAEEYARLDVASEFSDEVSELLSAECENQSILKAAGIVDDESAIAYMDKVRPILMGLDAQVRELKERCQADVDNLLSGVTEEFWRSL